MPAPRPSRSRWDGLARPLAALFVVTLLCGTTPEDAALFAKRRQRIAGMTHAEIEQLKRNYDEYRKLSPERRQALADLDTEVKQDSSGHLLQLLTGYNRWLSTLSPFDQERILATTDPVERAQLVKTIRDDQQKRQALASIEGGGRQALQPVDLDVVVKAVEDNFLTPESRKKIPDQLAGRERHLRVLSAAQLQLRNGDKSAAAGQKLVSMLIDAIPNETVRARILDQSSTRPRRRTLGQVLGRSLVSEWQVEIARAFPPQEAIDQEVAKKLVGGATPAARRDNQKAQLITRQGRRMIGVQIVLRSNDQFKELGNVYFWLSNGLQPRGTGRGQPVAPPDDTRTDEAETKTKSAD
jgi:hypothetical protein